MRSTCTSRKTCQIWGKFKLILRERGIYWRHDECCLKQLIMILWIDNRLRSRKNSSMQLISSLVWRQDLALSSWVLGHIKLWKQFFFFFWDMWCINRQQYCSMQPLSSNIILKPFVMDPLEDMIGWGMLDGR